MVTLFLYSTVVTSRENKRSNEVPAGATLNKARGGVRDTHSCYFYTWYILISAPRLKGALYPVHDKIKIKIKKSPEVAINSCTAAGTISMTVPFFLRLVFQGRGLLCVNSHTKYTLYNARSVIAESVVRLFPVGSTFNGRLAVPAIEHRCGFQSTSRPAGCQKGVAEKGRLRAPG